MRPLNLINSEMFDQIPLTTALRIIITISVCFIGTSDPGAEVIVDDFETSQPGYVLVYPQDLGRTEGVVTTGTGILGGERDTATTLESGTTDGRVIEVVVTAGSFVHRRELDNSGSTQITWDGSDGDAFSLDSTGLGGVDLTQGGTQDAVLIELDVEYYGSHYTDIEVFTDSENSSGVWIPLATLQLNWNLEIPHSSFRPRLGGGADFENVGAIVVSVDPRPSFSTWIHEIRTTSLLAGEKSVVDLDGGTVDPGDHLEYTVVLSNRSDDYGSSAHSVRFNDTVNDATTLICAPPNHPTTSHGVVSLCDPGAGGTVEVEVGSIGDGNSVTIVFQTVVSDPLPGGATLCNQGVYSSLELGGRDTNDPNTPQPDDPTCIHALPVSLMAFQVD